MIKKISYILLGMILMIAGTVYGAPYFNYSRTILPIDSTENIGTTTSPFDEGHFNELCLGGDCKTIWPTGGGGSGGGTFSTTTYNGRLLQYPYTTLITSLDGNATTTSNFWFDPFISKTFFSYASSTAQTIANAFITKLGNLASAGFVKTSSDGTLSVDTNTYLTGITSGNVITALGYTPLNQTSYFSTTTHNTITTIPNLSITKSQVSDFGSYVGSVSATYPVQSSGGLTPTISLAFGTSTSNTWGGTQAFTNTANFNTWTNNGSATTTNLAISALTGILVGNGSTKPISVAVSGTDFKTINGNSILGSGDLTISGGSGLSTSSPISSSNLLVYSSSGAGSAYGVATSTLTASSPLTGSFTQIGTGGSLGCHTASGSQAGCLSSTDWTTFNGKQDALGYTPLNQALYYSTTTFTSLTTAPNLSITKSQVSDFGTYENPLTFTYPLQRSVNTISSALTTTTANTWSGLQSFTNVGTTTFAGGLEGTYLNITGTAATSTFARGINLSGGCFAVNGVCISGGGGSGTVTSVDTNNGLTGGPITTSGTIGLNTTGFSNNALVAWNGSNLVATGTPQLTVGNILATSTTATSTFLGSLVHGSPTITSNAKFFTGGVYNFDFVDVGEGVGFRVDPANGLQAITVNGNGDYVSSNGSISINYSGTGSLQIGNTNSTETRIYGDYIGIDSTTYGIDFTSGTGPITFNSPKSYFYNNVGIGTTTPQYQLQVSSSTAPQLSLSDGTNNHWTMRNAGGNLYIGTSSPTTFATTTTAVFEATSATTTVRNVIDEKTFIVGDGTNAITTGAYASVQVPYNAKIMEWSIVSDDSASTACSIVIDVWKDTYANYPPTVTDTITASAKPTLSSANKNSGSAGTWNSTITEGDFLKFNVDSVSSCTHVTLKLKLKRQ